MAVREIGIQPDFIVCCSDTAIDEPIREKIALFCNVRKEDIISDPDVDNIYKVPLEFEKQEFGNKILLKFGLETARSNLSDWRQFVENMNAKRRVPIGIVGKYFDVGAASAANIYSFQTVACIRGIYQLTQDSCFRGNDAWLLCI